MYVIVVTRPPRTSPRKMIHRAVSERNSISTTLTILISDLLIKSKRDNDESIAHFVLILQKEIKYIDVDAGDGTRDGYEFKGIFNMFCVVSFSHILFSIPNLRPGESLVSLYFLTSQSPMACRNLMSKLKLLQARSGVNSCLRTNQESASPGDVSRLIYAIGIGIYIVISCLPFKH